VAEASTDGRKNRALQAPESYNLIQVLEQVKAANANHGSD
jgi:hypothetical protein